MLLYICCYSSELPPYIFYRILRSWGAGAITGDDIKQDLLLYTLKPKYFAILSNNIWSYLLWPPDGELPVVERGSDRGRATRSIAGAFLAMYMVLTYNRFRQAEVIVGQLAG